MAKEENEVKEVRIKPDLEKYVNGVSGSGKRTKRADNPVSEALDGFTVQETAQVAQGMGIAKAAELLEKYAHLNVGMQKMNIANLIRGAVTKLDKAHEADKAVVPGLKTLAINCEKGQAAVAKRRDAAAKAKEEREAKAAKKKADEAKAAKGKKAAA